MQQEVVFFNEGGGAQLELVQLGPMDGKQLHEAAACIGEVGGEDGEIRKEGHLPQHQDSEGDVVEVYFQGAQGGEGDDHAQWMRSRNWTTRA